MTTWWRRSAPIATLALAIVLCVPAIPSLIASLAEWPRVSDGAATAGHVAVTSCRSTLMGVTATCKGTFGYADPGGAAGAQPSTVTTDVTIANDPRHHRIGDDVDVSLAAGTRYAYVSSATEQLRVVLQVICCLVIVGVLVVSLVRVIRRQRLVAAHTVVALICGAAVFAGTWMLLPTPPAAPTGPEPPPAIPGPVTSSTHR